MASEERSLEGVTIPISLADQVRNSVQESVSFKLECSEIGQKVDHISELLRSIALRVTSSPPLYDRPIRCIVLEVTKTLEGSLTLVRRFSSGTLRRVFTILPSAAFRKLFSLLDDSIGDLQWLLFDSSGGLPPIARRDPVLALVWSFVSAIEMPNLANQVEAAEVLALLARDSDWHKKIIVEEGGIPPLSRLLKQGVSPLAQIAAATALSRLATEPGTVRQIVDELGVPLILQLLSDSPMKVQILVANLVARMAENDPIAQEEFAKENAVRSFVSFLSFYMLLDERNAQNRLPAASVHLHSDGTGSSVDGDCKEVEETELKLVLQTKFAEALWCLSKGSVSNSKRITETKGLLCLAKYIEKERGELKLNCLRIVMEIAGSVESNPDVRRAAFKANSPAAKAVMDQLLRVLAEEETPSFLIPTIKAIGTLARTSPAWETLAIPPLVTLLDRSPSDVAEEASTALGRFVCPDNSLCVQNSKAIADSDGVRPLVMIMRRYGHLDALILLCYLALHVGNSEVLQEERLLLYLQVEVRTQDDVMKHPLLKELIPKAILNLRVYPDQHIV